MSKKILMIVGSLRKESFNRQLANEAASLLNGKAEISFLDYTDVPFFNQDIEFPAPASIEHVREKINAADGIWIISAEYNFNIPGVLKNLLDWLSRPLEAGNFAGGTSVTGKAVTFSGAGGKNATAGMRGKLEELLTFMQMNVMKETTVGISLSRESFMTNKLVLSDENKEALKKQADAFIAFLGE